MFTRFTTENIILAFLVINFISLGILIGIINWHFHELQELDNFLTRQHYESITTLKNITSSTLRDTNVIEHQMEKLLNHTH